MSAARRRVGQIGEDAAALYLERAGWQVVQRNYRCRQGEIDIVARDGATLVFVEVRTRTSAQYGSPEESVTLAKARKMADCALAYLAGNRARDGEWRIDFIAIELARGRVTRLEHFRHALQ